MASSFPSPLLNLPLSSSSLSNSTAVGAITTGVCWRSGGRRSRGRTVIANATEKEEQGKDSPAFNPFGFVTDNPSSRSAIQLPESPAEDGNVGQMLYRIEDKGKEYGSYIRSGEFVWFVRETGSPDSRRGTIIFLHGAPTQSYSYRVVMSQIDLLPPPNGEGLSYEVFCKDLRPSLDWSPSYGWRVPSPMESETGRCCAQLVMPVNYVPAENEGRTDSQGRAGSSVKFNLSFSSHISDCSSPPPDGSEHSPEKEMTEQPLNTADSKKRKQTLKTKMDLHKGDMCIGKTSSSDSVSTSHVGHTSEERTIGGRDRCGNSGSSRKMGTDGSIALNSMHSDTLEAAILDLEELANKVKWVKGILEHGIPLPKALQPPWKFLEHRAPSTPK